MNPSMISSTKDPLFATALQYSDGLPAQLRLKPNLRGLRVLRRQNPEESPQRARREDSSWEWTRRIAYSCHEQAYSPRRASIGSTRLDRKAGIREASPATRIRTRRLGSRGCLPTSSKAGGPHPPGKRRRLRSCRRSSSGWDYRRETAPAPDADWIPAGQFRRLAQLARRNRVQEAARRDEIEVA